MVDVKEYLEENGIAFKEFSHNPVFTVEEAENEPVYKEIDGMHSKNLFIKDRKSRNFYLVVMPCAKPLQLKELEKILDEKIKFANPDNLKEILNLIPGAVGPFGLLNDKEHKVELLIDKDVWESDFVSFHPNDNAKTLQLSKEDFHKYVESLGNENRIIEL